LVGNEVTPLSRSVQAVPATATAQIDTDQLKLHIEDVTAQIKAIQGENVDHAFIANSFTNNISRLPTPEAQLGHAVWATNMLKDANIGGLASGTSTLSASIEAVDKKKKNAQSNFVTTLATVSGDIQGHHVFTVTEEGVGALPADANFNLLKDIAPKDVVDVEYKSEAYWRRTTLGDLAAIEQPDPPTMEQHAPKNAFLLLQVFEYLLGRLRGPAELPSIPRNTSEAFTDLFDSIRAMNGSPDLENNNVINKRLVYEALKIRSMFNVPIASLNNRSLAERLKILNDASRRTGPPNPRTPLFPAAAGPAPYDPSALVGRGSILLLRPWIELLTGSAIVLKGGSNTGGVPIGHHNFMLGDDAATGRHTGHFTFYFTVLIFEPHNIMILDDVYIKQYLCGMNTEVFSVTETQDLMNGGFQLANSRNRKSIIALAISNGTAKKLLRDAALDITGHFKGETEDADTAHYKNYAFAKKFKPARALQLNTVCMRGHFVYKKDSMLVTSINQGHLGPNLYTGWRRDIEGGSVCVKEQGYKTFANI